MQIHYNDPADHSLGIISLHGRLDAANSNELKTHFASWLKETRHFVIDCSDLDFIDSSGIGALVSCLRKSLDNQGDIHLATVNSKVKMVLELTRADQILAIHPDVDEALAAFTQP